MSLSDREALESIKYVAQNHDIDLNQTQPISKETHPTQSTQGTQSTLQEEGKK